MGKDSIFSEIDKQHNNLSKNFKLISDFVNDSYSTIYYSYPKDILKK
ncbi:hypothetical protein [Paramaledivibacter caminithermalis]|jgi:RNAse (barnase) inhibitor barstar|uniref:Uncharacterized protein n=1 Tax=Paramaledivibacter caminithermalis (strain DSM 15212 / CIP 107654 / DViRD3) TaxID=1121301 RepID=A0A1M6LHR9_PARC5|nr:hypothetical protein [Paramaledivibacter caminithermalis]SHJ70714.1 hypothetical protein SAMN02745912_00804 [Paramaledivibacter caminithermalis DSM 15212]